MKIQINPNETYEIIIPDSEVTSQRFFEILSRLNSIGKILGKSVGDEILSQPTAKVPKKAIKSFKATGLLKKMKNDRALFVDCLKHYYFLNKHGFREWAKEKIGMDFPKKNDFMTIHLRELVRKVEITPQEVGLLRFPHQGEGKNVSHLLLAKREE